MGVGLAELLASAGSAVVFATPHQVAAPYLDRTFEGEPARKRLHELRVDVRTATTLERIEPGACLLASYGSEAEVPCEVVVLVGSRRSNDALHRELRADPGRLEAVYAIGDCVAPREIAECIFDGHRLAREFDALHPATPLPYQRERRVVIA
jgi:dimethylamine/trimethylamine dehydrogenase